MRAQQQRTPIPTEAPTRRSASGTASGPQSTGGLAGVSIHLCASDVRHLAPQPGRQIMVWLTLVDLSSYNPLNAAEGGFAMPEATKNTR